MSWTFEVDRDDVTSTRVTEGPAVDAALADGHALLAVERVALTTNNVTYAKAGESLGYWRFFPAEAGYGIVPAWGFATVVRSATAHLEEGARLYGYLPLASHLDIAPERRGHEMVDTVAHRAGLPTVYNSYAPSPPYTGADDYRALLQPLLVTSFLIDAYLADAAFFGAERIVLSSASSKTAIGLAWFVKRRGGVEVVGLTSPANLAATQATGCYDRVVTYDETELLAGGTSSVFVDFAGDRALLERLHGALSETLVLSLSVGATRMSQGASASSKLAGVAPQFFFAPDHARARIEAWGAGGFVARTREATGAFVAANPWLGITFFRGSAGVRDAWQILTTTGGSPDVGFVAVFD